MSIKWAPSEWKTYQVGNVLKRASKPVIVESETIYREIGIRSHGKGIFHKNETTGAEIGNKRVFWIEQGCFIVNIVFAWERAVAQTSDAEQGMIASHRFPMYKPVKELLDLDFITYFFKSVHGNRLLKLASPGGAGRNKTLGQQRFAKLEIPLPLIEEQRKIAEILGAWDKAITLTERLIEAKQKHKKGLMQQLLTGKVRFPGFEGENWNKVKLNELIDRLEAGISVNSEDRTKNSDEVGILKTSAVTYGRFDESAHKTVLSKELDRVKCYPKKDSIIISRMNTLKFVGASAYIKQDYSSLYLPDRLWQTVRKHNNFSMLWLSYCLASPKMRRRISNLATGTSGSMKNISKKPFLNLKVDIPPFEEQQKIAAILTACDDEIDLLKRKASALREQKKGLMQQLLTGKVRVKV